MRYRIKVYKKDTQPYYMVQGRYWLRWKDLDDIPGQYEFFPGGKNCHGPYLNEMKLFIRDVIAAKAQYESTEEERLKGISYINYL